MVFLLLPIYLTMHVNFFRAIFAVIVILWFAWKIILILHSSTLSTKTLLSCDSTFVVVQQKKFLIPNKDGHMLAGVLHDVGSGRLAVLCHGFRSNKVARKKIKYKMLASMAVCKWVDIFHDTFKRITGMLLNASHLLCWSHHNILENALNLSIIREMVNY